jgi:hypothetical protein
MQRVSAKDLAKDTHGTLAGYSLSYATSPKVTVCIAAVM